MSSEPYPEIPLQPRPWWRRLVAPHRGVACAHAATIALTPDEAPLRNGRRAPVRRPPRPPIRVCVECLLVLLEPELNRPERRVVAFEPGAEGVASYRFLEQDHLGDSGLAAEDLIHCQSLVAEPLGGCQQCGQPAVHLLLKRGGMTEPGRLASFRGGKEYYCAAHGSARLVGLLRERLPKRPVACFNFPYGERGLYLPGE
jgi:hypothetical protein